MNIEKNSIVTLNNDEQYEVIEKINYKNNTYLLLSPPEKIELSLVKVEKEDDKYFFNELTQQEYEEVLLEININI